MTNDAALSERSFDLGGREFKVVDLAYDDYVKFLALLQPLLESVATKIAAYKGLVPTADAADTPITAAGVLKYCVKELPELVCIVCRATDPTVTVDEVKALGKNPFKLAGVVLTQIDHNKIIKDIGDFFVQMLPLLKVAMPMLGAAPTTPGTPS